MKKQLLKTKTVIKRIIQIFKDIYILIYWYIKDKDLVKEVVKDIMNEQKKIREHNMNKTQKLLASRLINRAFRGSAKEGWTLTEPRDSSPYLSLQKLNEINQAYGMAEKYPEVFKVESKMFRLVNLYLLDETKGRDLSKKFGDI